MENAIIHVRQIRSSFSSALSLPLCPVSARTINTHTTLISLYIMGVSVTPNVCQQRTPMGSLNFIILVHN